MSETCTALTDLVRHQGPALRSITINPQADYSPGMPLSNVFQILKGSIRSCGCFRTLSLGDVKIQVDALSEFRWHAFGSRVLHGKQI